MNLNVQTFQFESIHYTITKNDTVITIQIIKDKQIDAEQSYTIKQLKEISILFCLFSLLQSAYDELISLANERKAVIKEYNEYYNFGLKTNNKQIPTIDLIIPKQMSTPQPQRVNSNKIPNQESNNARLDKQEALIQKLNMTIEQFNTNVANLFNKEEVIMKRLELIESKINNRFDKQVGLIESLINKFDLKSNVIDSKAQLNQLNHYKNIEISNFNFEILPLIPDDDPISNSLPEYSSIGFLSEEETQMVSSFITQNKPFQCKLRYNPSQGNDTLEQCFASCNNFPSLLVLIETNKGFKFGGYTSVGWDTPLSDGSSNI